MTNRTDVLEQLRSANPVPDPEAIDATELAELLSMIDERRIADARPPLLRPAGAPNRRPVWAVAFAAVVAVLLVGGAALVLSLRSSDDPITTETAGPDESAAAAPRPEAPTVQPATEPAESPAPAGPVPEWTTFTTATGLPGDDVITLDTNADGTIWATVALDRQTVDYGYRVDDHVPGRLGFALFDGSTWTTVEPPAEIEGYVRLAAGPDGTAWLIGGNWQDGGGEVSDMALGTQGLWFYDGSEWITYFEGRPDEGELRPVSAEVGPDGTLWSSGHPTDGTGPVLMSFDGTAWTTVEPPEFPSVYAGMVDLAYSNFVDPDNDVWVFVDDSWSPGESAVRLARLDGETWTEFPAVLDTQMPDAYSMAYRYCVLEVNDGSYVFFSWALPSFHPDPYGDEMPAEVGDPIPYAFAEFDGATWSEVATGQLVITESHTLDKDFPMNAAAAGPDQVYLSDLGGLTQVDRTTGEITTFEVDDGLASQDVRDIVVAPDGSVWIATAAGISRYVPVPTG